MKIEQAKEFLPLVEALASGKTIQYSRDGSRNWIDLLDEADFFLCSPVHYRVKPEPKEYWFNRYESHEAGPYDSKDAAANHGGNTATQVRFREVVE